MPCNVCRCRVVSLWVNKPHQFRLCLYPQCLFGNLLEKVTAFLAGQSRQITARAGDNRLYMPNVADPLRDCVPKFIKVKPMRTNQPCALQNEVTSNPEQPGADLLSLRFLSRKRIYSVIDCMSSSI